MNNLLTNCTKKSVLICRDSFNEIIGIFESIKDAADEYLVDEHEIFESVRTKNQIPGLGYFSRENIMFIQKAEKEYKECEDLTLSTERGKHRHPKASVAVVQLDYETLALIARYHSMYDAYRLTGARNISKCCKGEAQSSGGFRWMFEEEYDAMINESSDLM